MKQVIQFCLSSGWGGLEMVLCEFHEWLVQNHVPARIVCLSGSPLERNCQLRGYSEHLEIIEPGRLMFLRSSLVVRKFNSKETAFLFHRQQGVRSVLPVQLQAQVSVLCHTFYDVAKKDLWHRFLFSKVDRWLVLTEAQKVNLLETISVMPSHISVIPNGVNLKLFRPRQIPVQREESEVRLGMISRLDPKKGQDLAIEALAFLKKENPTTNFHLHLFGHETPDQKPYRPTLEALVRRHRLEEFVHFRGYQERPELCLQEIDFLWVPSQRETFGRCILEALACQVPVIATQSGGVPEILKHEQTGLLFPPGEASALAEMTSRLSQDETLRKRLQTQGLQLVHEKYNSEVIWRRLLSEIFLAAGSPRIDQTPLKTFPSVRSLEQSQ